MCPEIQSSVSNYLFNPWWAAAVRLTANTLYSLQLHNEIQLNDNDSMYEDIISYSCMIAGETLTNAQMHAARGRQRQRFWGENRIFPFSALVRNGSSPLGLSVCCYG